MNEATNSRELTLIRTLNAPRKAVWRCWTEPGLLKQWFAPKPWTTPRAEMDVRPGGASLIVMRSPDGEDMPIPGVYLEVVPNEKLVVTDAYTTAWEPSEKPFMTIVLTFENEDAGEDEDEGADEDAGKTRYTARVLHWSAADREEHERMGFHEGWGQCTNQLEALAASL